MFPEQLSHLPYSFRH